MNEVTNPELGEKLGLAPGDTVEIITNDWDGLIADKGDRGKVTHFVLDGPTIFTYVQFDYGQFPFTADEIKKVEVGQ